MNEPKYQLNEIVEVRSLKINMNVIITKRIAKGDYDKGDYEFYYNFKHNMDIKDPWSWGEVHQESLDDMIWEAKQHRENTSKRIDVPIFF